MTKQEKLNPISDQKHPSPLLAAFLAILATLFIMGGTAKGAPGDQWILEIDHTQDGSFTHYSGAGYNGGDALEHSGSARDIARVYWTLNGPSVGTGNPVPTTTELYTIEWFVPTAGPVTSSSGYQPIESQFRGGAGEMYPNDPLIPWAGEYGTDHEYIAPADGTPGTWAATGPGPHTPDGSAYNCIGDDGTFMWLTSGSSLYVKWDYAWTIDRTWSALRLTQITPVTIQSLSKSGTTFTLTWVAIPGKTYQVQYKTDLTQAAWNNLVGTITATGSTATKSDTNPLDTRRFYRVALQP